MLYPGCARAGERGGCHVSASVLNTVRRGFYLDSVALMRLSRAIATRPGVQEAALMMATPANKRILADAGLLSAEGKDAAPNDLILAIRAVTADAANSALCTASALLDQPRKGKAAGVTHP